MSRVTFDEGSVGGAPSVISLGDQLEKQSVYGVNHPKHERLTQMLTDELQRIVDRESQRAGSRRSVIITEGVSVPQQAAMEREYPEYSIKWLPLHKPVHADFVARRQLASEHMGDFVRRYADTVIHMGSGILNTVLRNDDKVHFETDEENPVAAHENHSAMVSVLRLGSAGPKLAEETGIAISPDAFRKFVTGSAWARCVRGQTCAHKADAFTVDLSMYPMSMSQVMAGMLQAGATVGAVMLPYHPIMLRQSDGELPGFGFHYSINEQNVVFKYPEGTAGASHFDLVAWHEWLAADYRRVNTVNGQRAFKFEIRNVRGCFLFITLVEVDPKLPEPKHSQHALDLHYGKGLVLVRCPRLKSLAHDPVDPSSWEEKEIVATQSVVSKLYELGMSQPQAQFSKYALIKRAAVVDSRVTTEGTSVSVNPALSEADMHHLVLAVHARAFVDRYNMGTLHSKLMHNLDAVAGFSKLSYGHRFLAVLYACHTGLWDFFIGNPLDGFRNVMDRFRAWIGRLPSMAMPYFQAHPTFMKFEKVSEAWIKKWAKTARSMVFRDYYLRDLRGSYVVPHLQVAPSSRLASGSATKEFRTGVVRDDVVDIREQGPTNSDQHELTERMAEINDFLGEPESRFNVASYEAVPTADAEAVRSDYNIDPDYVQTLTHLHEAVFPGIAQQDYEVDPASLSLDPQDRTLEAEYLRFPSEPAPLPADRKVFKSRIQAYQVEKRPQTTPELLSSMTARNLSAPRLSLPQNNDVLFLEIWDVFLNTACRPEARDMLLKYQSDPLQLGKEAFVSWTKKAKPEALKSMLGDLALTGKAFEEYDVGEYIAMLKADVKPPLSDKPNHTRIEPQVIVYHQKILSSLYSSIFRVIADRFLSLLKPNILFNLKKDRKGIKDHIQVNHPWGVDALKYLENDFSKYDKSQGEFVFLLEAFIFEQLGLNKQLLDRWLAGHAECKIRAFSLGLVLHLQYQRKSGDATTALGNGILNMVSVMYAYRGSDIVWAVFMGDDSLACVKRVVGADDAVQVLGEIFNLQAKFYITDAPYFASMFIKLDERLNRVSVVPDPMRLIERWAMSVNAEDPMWHERWVSARDVCSIFESRVNTAGVGRMMRERYPIPDGVDVEGVFDAVATCISTEERFRAKHEASYTLIHY